MATTIPTRRLGFAVGRVITSSRIGYYAKCEFMHGDGDQYTTEYFSVMVPPRLAAAFLNQHWMMTYDHDEAIAHDGTIWSNDGESTWAIGEDWPSDVTSSDMAANLHNWSLVYYRDGAEHEVYVSNNDQDLLCDAYNYRRLAEG